MSSPCAPPLCPFRPCRSSVDAETRPYFTVPRSRQTDVRDETLGDKVSYIFQEVVRPYPKTARSRDPSLSVGQNTNITHA